MLSRSVLASALASAAVLASPACGAGGSDDSTDDSPRVDAPADGFDRTALLAHLGREVLLPLHTAFQAKASALPAVVGAYCTALDAGAPGSTREDAQAAWGEAMDAWQRVDSVLVGPAAMDGRTLRDRIYAWPLVSPCGINRDVASRWMSPSSYDAAAQPVNERSLAGVEVLLFITDPAHGCPTPPAGWDTLAADLPRARCRLAEQIAMDVAASARALDTAWRADGGDFAGELARAGMSGAQFPTEQAALNAISNGLFYADRMVKDMKLAQPAGIGDNACATVQEPCLREVEHPLSDRASLAIRANLESLRAVFTGTPAHAGGVDGPGFDELLRAVGAVELADRLTANLDAAMLAADAIPDSFVTALGANYDTIVRTHAAVRAVTDDLKTQFLTVLALETPDDLPTDND